MYKTAEEVQTSRCCPKELFGHSSNEAIELLMIFYSIAHQ